MFTQNPTFTNQLYFDPLIPGFTNFAGQSYTNTFYFRAVKPTVTNLAISPFAFVDSGSGTKHTAITSLANSGGSNVIFSATNIINIATQTVTPGSLFAPGGMELLAGFGSRIGLPAEATLLKLVPFAGAVTVTVSVVKALDAIVGRLLQSTWPPLTNPLLLALTKLNAAGKLSVTDKPVSGDGPKLLTTMV